MPLLAFAGLVGITVTKTVRFIFYYFLPAIDEAVDSEFKPAALFNDREKQNEVGPAAAVLDIAASLDKSSTAALFQVAIALFEAADTVHAGKAALERTCHSSLLANASAPPVETTLAAVLQHYESFLDAADAVYNSSIALHQTRSDAALFDTAVVAFHATALQGETGVSVVHNLAEELYSAANALKNVSTALESIGGPAATDWCNATVTVNTVATALHDDSPARAVFDAAVAVLNATVSASALFKDGGDGVGLGNTKPVLNKRRPIENIHFGDSM